MYQEEEQVQVKRRQSERAVQLAMAKRWEDAVAANKAILDVFPNDTDSYNRLGKALMELGRYPAARKAYRKALELDPANQIAKKNLERIAVLSKEKNGDRASAQADPSLFIEEMGKSVLTVLEQTDEKTLVKLRAGDEVQLTRKKDDLIVETMSSDRVGSIEQKLRSRILKLLEGGSTFAAAVTAINGNECRIIIKETYRDPSQTGPSFPTAITTEKLRPYTKDTLIQDRKKSASSRDDDEIEDDVPDDDTENEWDEDSLDQEGHLSINDAADAEDEAEAEEIEE